MVVVSYVITFLVKILQYLHCANQLSNWYKCVGIKCIPKFMLYRVCTYCHVIYVNKSPNSRVTLKLPLSHPVLLHVFYPKWLDCQGSRGWCQEVPWRHIRWVRSRIPAKEFREACPGGKAETMARREICVSIHYQYFVCEDVCSYQSYMDLVYCLSFSHNEEPSYVQKYHHVFMYIHAYICMYQYMWLH